MTTSLHVKVMPDVDMPLTEITRAKRLAAAMIDTALRKRFELMVAEFQHELDTVERRPVSQEPREELRRPYREDRSIWRRKL